MLSQLQCIADTRALYKTQVAELNQSQRSNNRKQHP